MVMHAVLRASKPTWSVPLLVSEIYVKHLFEDCMCTMDLLTDTCSSLVHANFSRIFLYALIILTVCSSLIT
jgi:hypothetical protein